MQKSKLFFICLFSIAFAFSANSASKLTPTPKYTDLSKASANVAQFELSLNKLSESLRKIVLTFSDDYELSENKRNALLYTYTTVNKVITLNKRLNRFNKNIIFIYKGHEEIKIGEESYPPTREQLTLAKEKAENSIKNVIKVFSDEALIKTLSKNKIDLFKNLNYEFYNFSLASKNITYSISRLLSSHTIATTLIEFKALNQALHSFYLDMGYYLPREGTSPNMLDAEQLVKSKSNIWSGPYITFPAGEKDGRLNHIAFDHIEIYQANDRDWQNPKEAKALCRTVKDCYAYICFTKLPAKAKVNLELKLDDIYNPKTGNFRYLNNGLGCYKGDNI